MLVTRRLLVAIAFWHTLRASCLTSVDPVISNTSSGSVAETMQASAEVPSVVHHEENKEGEYGVSCMLLGSVVSVMALFIATNLEDDDMRYYVWEVISSTIAILVAILLFTCINGFVHSVALHGKPKWCQVLWDFVQCLLYNLVMQITVAICVVNAGDSHIAMRCWGILMAHASGFSAIHFGGCMQQGDLFDIGPRSLLLFLPPVVMAVALWLMFVMYRLLRACVVRRMLDQRPQRVSMREDDTAYSYVPQDEPMEEVESQAAVELSLSIQRWEATIYEAENDVSALCISFLIVQAIRSMITGVMPDEMGNEAAHYQHRDLSLQIVGACAVGFLVLTVAMGIFAHKCFTSDHLADMAAMHQGWSWSIFFFLLGKRCSLVGAQACAMGMSWCLLCDSQWFLSRYHNVLGTPIGINFKMLMALCISLFAFCVTLVLDKVADAEMFADEDTEEMSDMAIIRIIGALGILVGFSWEHSFDRAVHVVVDVVPCPSFIKDVLPSFLPSKVALNVIGTLGISSLVVFSWRKYVLPKVLKLEELREMNLATQKELARRRSMRNSQMTSNGQD